MLRQMTAIPSAEPAIDVRRYAVRLSGDLLLRMTRVIAEGVDADMVTACIFLAITRANVRDVTRRAQQTPIYSAVEDIPPDELRRPVSVYALARELRIPYETVRRHVAKLVEAGQCVRVEDGLVVPSRVFAQPRLLRTVEQNWELTLYFLRALAACGVEATPGVAKPPTADVRRQVQRLSTAMFLDSLERLTERVGLDLVHTLLYVTIVQANVRHLSGAPATSPPFAALGEVPPDSERKPVSVYAVAREMRLPYETARRQVNKMIELGLVERAADGGVFTPTAVHARADWVAGTDESWRAIRALLDDLAQIGVTARTPLE